MRPLVSFSIMAYEGRAQYVPGLQDALGGCPVYWDPMGSRPREMSLWPVRAGAMALLDPRSMFGLVIQDDAVLCSDFHERLQTVLTDPTKAYCLYWRVKNNRRNSGFNDAGKAALAAGGFDWDTLMWGIATAVPTHMIDPMVTACELMDDTPQDDVRMRRWLRDKGVLTHYPLPSLVSQRAELAGRNGPNRGRVAKWFE